ncbi:hypothetical protein DFJ74DRAFT_717404 [Hyaloraphidium curvatum]|nr:hypothetical protein DFJ74DRAFT_717404 [Hyaloraphidium curvatum]
MPLGTRRPTATARAAALVLAALVCIPGTHADNTGSMVIRVVNLARETLQFKGNGANSFVFVLSSMGCYDIVGPAFDSGGNFYVNALNGSNAGYSGISWTKQQVPVLGGEYYYQVQAPYGSGCCGGTGAARWWFMAPGPYCGGGFKSCVNGLSNGYPGYWTNTMQRAQSWQVNDAGLVSWSESGGNGSPPYVPYLAAYTAWNETGNKPLSPWVSPLYAMSQQCASSGPLPDANLPSQVAAQNLSSYPGGNAPLAVLQNNLATVQGINQTNITVAFNCTSGLPALHNPSCETASSTPSGWYSSAWVGPAGAVLSPYAEEALGSAAELLGAIVQEAANAIMAPIRAALQLEMGDADGLLEPTDVVAALEQGRLVEEDLLVDGEEDLSVSLEWSAETEGVLEASAYAEMGVALDGGGLVFDAAVESQMDAAEVEVAADVGADIVGDILMALLV